MRLSVAQKMGLLAGVSQYQMEQVYEAANYSTVNAPSNWPPPPKK